MRDPGGRVTAGKAGAESIKGYTQADILGRHFSVFHHPDDVAAGEPDRTLQRALRDGRAESEGLRIRRDSTAFWAINSLHAVHNPDGSHAGFAKITRDCSERLAADDAQRHAHDELERKIAARTHATTLAKEEAEETNLTKNKFLAHMSPARRKPLNTKLHTNQNKCK